MALQYENGILCERLDVVFKPDSVPDEIVVLTNHRTSYANTHLGNVYGIRVPVSNFPREYTNFLGHLHFKCIKDGQTSLLAVSEKLLVEQSELDMEANISGYIEDISSQNLKDESNWRCAITADFPQRPGRLNGFTLVDIDAYTEYVHKMRNGEMREVDCHTRPVESVYSDQRPLVHCLRRDPNYQSRQITHVEMEDSLKTQQVLTSHQPMDLIWNTSCDKYNTALQKYLRNLVQKNSAVHSLQKLFTFWVFLSLSAYIFDVGFTYTGYSFLVIFMVLFFYNTVKLFITGLANLVVKVNGMYYRCQGLPCQAIDQVRLAADKLYGTEQQEKEMMEFDQ